MASYYLKFGDIDGDVTEPAYRTWIELKSWSWGAQRDSGGHTGGSGGSGGSGGGISCIHELDSASAALYQYCASGKHGDLVLDVVRERGGVLVRVEIPDALVDSVQTNPPTEMLWFSGKVKVTKEPGTPPP